MVSRLALLVAALAAPPQAADPACPASIEILVERGYASRVGIETGDVVSLRRDPAAEPCRARVAGLFEPPPDPSRLEIERPRVLLHLPDLASMAGRANEVDQFTIRLRDGVDMARTTGALETALPGAQVLSTARVAEGTSTTFSVVERFHRAIGLITLVAGGVFMACIMVLKVQERRGPIAAARLIGVPKAVLFGWTMAESAILAGLGAAMGVGVGWLASLVINAVYQRAYDTALVFAHITTPMVLQVVTLAIGLGLVAGAYAGRRLLSADPLRTIER